MTTERRFTGSLRLRFLVLLLAVAVLPLMIVTAVIAQRAFSDLEGQSLTQQQELAAGISAQVRSIVLAREGDLAFLDEVIGLTSLDEDEQKTVLRNLLAQQPMFHDLALVDATGREQVRLDRDSVVLESSLRTGVDDASFLAARSGATYFGPVRFDDEVREPLTTIAYPMVDRRSGQVAAVVVASVTFKPIWELLGGLDLQDGRDVYVVNSAGDVVAHRDPAVVLRGTQLVPPMEPGRAAGLSGEKSAVASHVVRLGDQTLTIVAEQPLSTALRVASRAIRVTIIVGVLAILAVSVLTILLTRKIVRPIEDLAASARAVTAGDLSHRAVVQGEDEIAALADAFNHMTAQLNAMIETLEQRVSERTADLEQAADMQRRLIAELESKNEQLLTAHDQLEKVMRSKDEFLGSVSHELRTPLASIVGFAAELRDAYGTFRDEERLELISLIASQSQDMGFIINDLLVAARADAGALVVEPGYFEIGPEVLDVVDQLAGSAARAAVPARPIYAYADEARVRQILRNLVTNALRHGGPDLEAILEEDGQWTSIQVRDNGEGIPRDEWESIFDPYRRAQHSRVNPASIGLGLTVSRTLARCMGGDLSYRYEHGRSVFELILPAHDKVPSSLVPGVELSPAL